MSRKIMVIIPLAILMCIVIQDMGMTKRIFDTSLKFNPKSGMAYHYAQQTNIYGTETSFQRTEDMGGLIQTIFDETCNSNSDGLVGMSLNYQTWDVVNELNRVQASMPNGGPWGPGRSMGRNPRAPRPGDNGNSPGPDGSQPAPGIEPQKNINPDDYNSEPKQGTGPDDEGGTTGSGGGTGPGGGGSGGGGGTGPGGGGGGGTGPGGGGGGTGGSGGAWGQQQQRRDTTTFRITPILETQLDYTLSQDGRLMDIKGLDLIGDFYDPQNQITVRQVFQSSHFLTVPNYEVHVGESWKGPFFWTIPFVGETRKIDMQYTIDDITIQERFRVAKITFYAVDQFDTVTTNEKWDDEFGCDVRVDSDLHCDIMLSGNILFDIDRGIIVAIGEDIGIKQYMYYWGSTSFPRPDGYGFIASVVIDRVDTRTPLGNVLDTEPRKDHIIQDMWWFSWLIIE